VASYRPAEAVAVADRRDEAGALGPAVVVGVGVPADAVALGVPADAVALAEAAVAGGVVFEALAEADALVVGAGPADRAGPALVADTGTAGSEAEFFFATTFLTCFSDEALDTVWDAAADAAALGMSVVGAIELPPAKATPSTIVYPIQPTPAIIPTRRIVRARPPDESTKTGPSWAGRFRRRVV
jgi:hypothetical protein